VVNAERMWSANERLLQSYRLIFILSQTFMLGVGALFWGVSWIVLCLVGGISVCIIWGVWVPVVFARHRIVDYYKHACTLTDTEFGSLCTEAEYVSNADSRRKANELFKIHGNLGVTRLKLDIIVPSALSLLWVVFVVSAYVQ
jgi:hypothetical protein